MRKDVRNLLELAEHILKDVSAKCPASVSTKDLMTIRSRVENEGISFLTITLPAFAKDFERALDEGGIGPHLFTRWRRAKGGRGASPAFLRGLLDQIFDSETGRLYDEVANTPTLVEAVREICLFFKKVELPCTPQRDMAALDNYIAVEHDFEVFQPSQQQLEEFRAVCWVLWSDVLRHIHVDDLVPKHGPGATAERISGNQKYVWRRWYERLEPYFPFLGVGISVNACGLEDDDSSSALEMVTFVPEEEEQPVRVTLVPKTLKGPRVIAIEPVCMQYAQQAVQAALYRLLESHGMTKGHVNFTDQEINRGLALASSSSGQQVTIDLSDASDRVPLDLVLLMLESVPDLRDAILACRSTRAELPDGRITGPLKKFASMGSALCFPIEAVYFYTICVAASLKAKNLPITRRNVYDVSRGVYVYGDDIIVPHDVAGTVLDYLQQYNCKVNWAKSFTNGKFRESCGLDAYDGIEVTPVYLRRMPPENRQQVSEIISWVATANALQQKGYVRTASLMFDRIEQLLGPLPEATSDSSYLGRVVTSRTKTRRASRQRWNTDLMCWETKAWVPESIERSDGLGGYFALQKCLLGLEARSRNLVIPAPRRDHWESSVSSSDPGASSDPKGSMELDTTVLRGAVTLKRRWVPATI